jgi:hypothetical protein
MKMKEEYMKEVIAKNNNQEKKREINKGSFVVEYLSFVVKHSLE